MAHTDSDAEALPSDAVLLGRGRSAEVYALVGEDTVLRRYFEPGRDVKQEAVLMKLAHQHGVPTPVVHRAAGRDLVMERVSGPTMLQDLLAHPERAAEHGSTLARLHTLLGAVLVPCWLDLPTPTGSPGSLLHGDLHPDNVILTAAGPVLVDWTNAMSGPSAVDVAITWLAVACLRHPDPAVDSRVDDVREALLGQFLAEVDRGAAAQALPLVARLRSEDPATTEEERASIAQVVTTMRG